MFLRPNHRSKDGKEHTYWSLVESVRTPDGPRQRTLCHLGELNGSDHARWLRTVEVFNEQGEAQQLKLFPSHVEPPPDDSQVARILVNKVRLERTRQFGACYLGLELWKRLELDRFFEQALDDDAADVPWSRVAAVLAINRLCAPGSELAIEQRWYPSTALDDLLGIADGQINDTRLYRCLDRILPHKTKLEQHLKDRYGALFGAEFDVLLYDLTSIVCGGGGGEESDDTPRLFAGSSARLRTDGNCADRQPGRVSLQLRNLRWKPGGRIDHGNDPAHGGAQVWQGAADLGIRSRHCERGEPGGDPQARRSIPGGDATQPDEAVRGRVTQGGLDAGTARGESQAGGDSARRGDLYPVPHGGPSGKGERDPETLFEPDGGRTEALDENHCSGPADRSQQDRAPPGRHSGSAWFGEGYVRSCAAGHTRGRTPILASQSRPPELAQIARRLLHASYQSQSRYC